MSVYTAITQESHLELRKKIFIRGPGNCEAYMSVYTAVGQESHLELSQQN